MLTFATTLKRTLIAGTTAFNVSVGSSDSGVPLYIIEDLDEGMSVTNNAENVILKIADCTGNIPDNSVIVYKDTEGVYDQLLVTGGCFAGFAPLGADFADEAIYIATRAGALGRDMHG